MTIQNNAIFIADSHYNANRDDLFNFLLNIKKGKIVTNQLFFMGDIFDFLSSEIDYFKFINLKVTLLINELSQTHDIIYIEGNHDFNLKEIFPNINVISRKNQPLNIIQNRKTISLAHGDIFTPKSYDLFASVLRNHYFMKCINFIDIKHCISKSVEKKLMKKKICHKQDGFDKFIEKRITQYNVDLIIEGHFHQGCISDKYINIPSLACDNRYMVYQNNQFSFNTL